MLDAAWTRAYLGIPFVDHGRDRTGLDCWGLVRLVYAEQFGIGLPSLVEGYRDTGEAERIAELYRAERSDWDQVSVPRSGDAVMFRILGIPFHVGVIAGAGLFLHAFVGRNSCVERLTSPVWRPRVNAFYRHRSLS